MDRRQSTDAKMHDAYAAILGLAVRKPGVTGPAQAVIFASTASNAAAALGKSLKASPQSADCF